MMQVCREPRGFVTFVPNSGAIEPANYSDFSTILQWAGKHLDREPVLWEVLLGTWNNRPEITLVQQEVRCELALNPRRGTPYQYIENARIVSSGTRTEVLEMFKVYTRML